MSRLNSKATWTLGLVFLAIGCGPDATAPSSLGPISLSVVSGNAQSGVVGTELPQPLVIKATDSRGVVQTGLTVNFRVTSGGGSMYAGTAVTDSKGIADDYWTLGTSTAQTQRVEVRAVLSNGQKQVYGTFTATPLPGPAAKIAIQAGNGQTAYDLTAVAVAPAVQLQDQYSNPAQTPGVSVTFVPAAGSGTVTNGTVSTAANGIATVGSWTLGGPLTGENRSAANTLTATAASLSSSVTFTATSVGNFWTTKASTSTARVFPAAGVVNGVLDAVGGENNTGVLSTVEAYVPSTDTWTTKASMPTARVGPGVAAINGIVYAVGGQGANSAILATVEAYHP